eukprot:439025_1
MGSSNCCTADKSKIAQLQKSNQKRQMKKIKSINKKSFIKNTEKRINNPTTNINDTTHDTTHDINNWIEEEKNMKMDRVHRLSLIEFGNADAIRELVKQQYIDTDNELDDDDDDNSVRLLSDSDTESNISDLSSAGRQIMARKSSRQLLKVPSTQLRKSNLTPKSIESWNDNDVIDLQNEIKEQMEYLKKLNSYSKTETQNLFRVKSFEKWDDNDVRNEQFAMQEQMIHLIQTNTQRPGTTIDSNK